MAKTDSTDKKSSGAKSEAKRVGLLFHESRTYELKIGNFSTTFEGYQFKEVPAWVINHDDWASETHMFSVLHNPNPKKGDS